MQDQDRNSQQPLSQEPQEITGRKHVEFRWILGSLLFIVLVAFGLNFFLPKSDPMDDTLLADTETISESPREDIEEPLPFREMTIPFLRSRTYTSSLTDLEAAYDNVNYTAYLTGYDSDGFNVNGLLLVPTGEMPIGGWPAIVFVHGYIPPTQYQTIGQYTDYIDYLARNGFVVFKIDLRGHGNSEGEAGGGYYGSDYIVDTLNAHAALASSDFVNPDAIGLWGHSMAGNVVLRSMAAKPDIPATVIWAGAVYSYEDWEKYGIDDNSYRPPNTSSDRQRRRQLLFDTHGRFSPESEFWQQVAPTNYLNDLTGAIQINHAINDNVVNVGYSRDLIARLENTTVPHELNIYDGGGHNISEPYFSEAMQNTVDFFKNYLQ